jgi:hypothetical protein
MAMFIKGLSIEESEITFEKLAKLAFKPRKVPNIPFICRIYKLLKTYSANGLYLAENIETALKEFFGIDRSILNCLYATSIGTRVGVPVATIRELSSCIFTNYNSVGSREQDHGKSLRKCCLKNTKLTKRRVPCNTARGRL